MFTSKKAQYVNGKFEKISPITNIDSLYYEQVIYDNDTFHVDRHSVAKHMPIWFNANSNIESIAKNESELNNSQLYEVSKHIILNTGLNNSRYDEPTAYKTNLFKIKTDTFVDLHQVLLNFPSVYEFQNAVTILNPSVNSVSVLLNELEDLIYNNRQESPSINNDIYAISYNDVSIKLQNISLGSNINAISLDESNTFNWIDFHYNINQSNLTYLQDSSYNEGNFDFLNNHLINGNQSNNKIYCNLQYANTINFVQENIEISISNNEIYNSSHILFTRDVNSNIIINSNHVQIDSGQNNKIINLTNAANASTKIKGSNNTIINCSNCIIEIDGNGNYIANLNNISLKLENNNFIIGDGNTNPINTINFNNNRLFLNGAVLMAKTHNLTSNYTIFGSSTNKVDVYADSINTISQ